VLLRPQAMAGLIFAAGFLAGEVAIAEPLDKESCANLQIERKKLLTRDMQAALDQGPDWVKDHLNDEAIERVRHFLSVEEQIQFRCRGGGVAKVPAKSTDAAPEKAATVPENAATVPLPDRKPTMPAESGDGKPSQAVADSDKTPPGKSRATR
jgi:hypothetical protein